MGVMLMETLNPHTSRHLTLDSLATNPGLTRRLPLIEVRPKEIHRPLRLLVCTQASPMANEVQVYAQAIGELLDAHIIHFYAPVRTGTALNALVEKAESDGYGLVILAEPDQPLIERLVLGSVGRRAAKRVPTSLLVIQRPRWPLRKMLLIIRGEEGDDIAVDWIVRLARLSGATATVFTVVSPVPAMYRGMARMQQGLTSLLAGDDTLGRQVRRAVQQLADWKIENTLRLCQGSPDLLICHEMVEGNYDLVVVAAECHNRWLRFLMGELVVPMLRWADQPVLIARP